MHRKMLLLSVTLSWFLVNQSLILLLSRETTNMNIAVFGLTRRPTGGIFPTRNSLNCRDSSLILNPNSYFKKNYSSFSSFVLFKVHQIVWIISKNTNDLKGLCGLNTMTLKNNLYIWIHVYQSSKTKRIFHKMFFKSNIEYTLNMFPVYKTNERKQKVKK